MSISNKCPNFTKILFMQTITTNTGLLEIQFDDSSQLKKFVKWFKKEGYDQFSRSKYNDEEPITCIATDEKMEWGHYFELQ